MEVENQILLSDTASISTGNSEIIDGYELIHPIEISYKGHFFGDNALWLIDTILKSTNDEYMNLITTYNIFEELTNSDTFNMRVQCLSPYRNEFYRDFITFGYIGKYTSYINRIYNINYIEELSTKSVYEFSIVIPARNSAYNLQHTIMTCLEQRRMSSRDYEIVISNNSDSKLWRVTLVDTGINSQTGSSVAKVRKYIEGEPFILTYGDGVFNVNLSHLLDYHQSSKSIATIAAIQPGGRFGVLDLEKNNMVKKFSEKAIEDGGWINGGFMVFESGIFDYLSEQQNCVLETAPMAL